MVMWPDSLMNNKEYCFLDSRQGLQISSSTASRPITGFHPASYPMGNGGRFPGLKRPGHGVIHSPPFSAEVTNASSYTSTSPYVFIAWGLIN
jgi:hypothetical protein